MADLALAIVQTVYTTAVPMVQIKNMRLLGNRGAINAIGTALMNPQHVFPKMICCTVRSSVIPTSAKIFFI